MSNPIAFSFANYLHQFPFSYVAALGWNLVYHLSFFFLFFFLLLLFSAFLSSLLLCCVRFRVEILEAAAAGGIGMIYVYAPILRE